MPLMPINSTAEALTVSSTAVPLVNGASGGSAANATYAVMQVLSYNIRYAVDGSTPTATLGYQAVPGSYITLSSNAQVRNFKAIRESSNDAALQIFYYGGTPDVGQSPVPQVDPKIFTTSFGATTFSGALTPTAGIAAAGGFTARPQCIHTGDIPAQVSTDGNDTTPVITETYIAAVFIPCNMTITGVRTFNGSVASGNIKLGLFDSTGANVAATASTAMSGTDSYQQIAFSSPYAAVGPATYYVGQQIDNITARVNFHAFGAFPASKKTGETYGTFTTITPPTTFTANQGPMVTLY